MCSGDSASDERLARGAVYVACAGLGGAGDVGCGEAPSAVNENGEGGCAGAAVLLGSHRLVQLQSLVPPANWSCKVRG